MRSPVEHGSISKQSSAACKRSNDFSPEQTERAVLTTLFALRASTGATVRFCTAGTCIFGTGRLRPRAAGYGNLSSVSLLRKRNSDFEHAILKCCSRFFSVHTFGQRDRSPRAAVSTF